MLDYLMSFFIGGAVIAGTRFLAQVLPPPYASMLGGLPLGILASFFIENQTAKKQYYAGFTYSAFLLFIAVLLIHIVSTAWPTAPVDAISAICLFLWGLSSAILISKFVIEKGNDED